MFASRRKTTLSGRRTKAEIGVSRCFRVIVNQQRQRRVVLSLAMALLAVAAFFGFRAAGIGKQSPPASSARALVPQAEYAEKSPHVVSSLDVIGVVGSVRGQPSVPRPDLPPVSAKRFEHPVAEYIAYSVRQLQIMEPEIAALRAALQSGNRSASKAAWKTVFARYLRLGAVYLEGPIASLNDEIDGNPGGLRGGTSSPDFTGLHRIEFGLWTGQSPRRLIPYVNKLADDVNVLKATLPSVHISPLSYATRAHEILEDAVRDLLSGADVPWSGAGVLGTAAGLAATREVLVTLRPVLVEPSALAAEPPADPRSLQVVDADLKVLQSTLRSLVTESGGEYPSNRQLTKLQSERLDAAVGQALEGLAQVPGMLETVNPPAIQQIPKKDLELDR